MEKLAKKNIDLIIGNLIHDSMNQETTQIKIIDKNNEILELPKGKKKDIAFKILEHIHSKYSKEFVNEFNC